MARNEPLVPDLAVEEALDFLHGSAADIGRARGLTIKTEKMLNVVRSQVVLRSEERSDQRRLADAYCSEQYLKAIDAHVEAVTRWETLSAKREASKMTIEAWRTANANMRNTRIF